MYVCLCHVITERQVRSAIQDGGAGTAAEVYRHFECQPRCGKCVPMVKEMVKESRDDCGNRQDGRCACSAAMAVAAE